MGGVFIQKLKPPACYFTKGDSRNLAKFLESPFLKNIFKWLFPILCKTDLLPCETVYIIDFEHVKGNWNIARAVAIIVKLEGRNSCC